MSKIDFKNLIEAPIDYLVENPGVSALKMSRSKQ